MEGSLELRIDAGRITYIWHKPLIIVPEVVILVEWEKGKFNWWHNQDAVSPKQAVEVLRVWKQSWN